MNKRIKGFGCGKRLALAVLAAFSIASSAIAAEPMKLADANAVFAQWIKAYDRRDAEKIMAVFDKSLIYSAQGEGDQTFAELKANYLSFFATKSPPTRWKATPKEIHAQGDLAIVISQWELREKTSKGTGDLIQETRSIDIFRRTKAGWRIVRTFNYPEAT